MPGGISVVTSPSSTADSPDSPSSPSWPSSQEASSSPSPWSPPCSSPSSSSLSSSSPSSMPSSSESASCGSVPCRDSSWLSSPSQSSSSSPSSMPSSSESSSRGSVPLACSPTLRRLSWSGFSRPSGLPSSSVSRSVGLVSDWTRSQRLRNPSWSPSRAAAVVGTAAPAPAMRLPTTTTTRSNRIAVNVRSRVMSFSLTAGPGPRASRRSSTGCARPMTHRADRASKGSAATSSGWPVLARRSYGVHPRRPHLGIARPRTFAQPPVDVSRRDEPEDLVATGDVGLHDHPEVPDIDLLREDVRLQDGPLEGHERVVVRAVRDADGLARLQDDEPVLRMPGIRLLLECLPDRRIPPA